MSSAGPANCCADPPPSGPSWRPATPRAPTGTAPPTVADPPPCDAVGMLWARRSSACWREFLPINCWVPSLWRRKLPDRNLSKWMPSSVPCFKIEVENPMFFIQEKVWWRKALLAGMEGENLPRRFLGDSLVKLEVGTERDKGNARTLFICGV